MTMTDIAIVTGAGSGIGAAIAARLAARGDTVFLFGRREKWLKAVAASIDGNTIVHPGDVRNRDHVQAVVARAEELGGVTHLVNNAGIMPIAPMKDANSTDWRDTLDVNVLGALHAIEAVLPGMRSRASGHIISISSVAGRSPFPGAAVYSASKAALDSLSEGLRAESAADHKRGGPSIRVTTIAPGAVTTNLTESIRDESARAGTEAYYDSMSAVLCPDDIANAVMYAIEQPPHVCVSEIVLRPTEMIR
jgi:NADP-dependent 3-hydroxy acid dehydrogenase YdfG